MKRTLTSLKFVPVYGLAALLVCAFVSGALIGVRYQDGGDYTESAVPSSWLMGGLETVGIALLAGALLLIAAALRYFAYARIESATGPQWCLTVPAIALEAVLTLVPAWALWVATEPIVDAGFAIIFYIEVSVVALALSIAIRIAAIVAARSKAAAAPAA